MNVCAPRTPCVSRVWDNLPPESRTGRVRMLVPQSLPPGQAPAGFVHLAATGDQGFERRLNLGLPLIKQVGKEGASWFFFPCIQVSAAECLAQSQARIVNLHTVTICNRLERC